ncbi:CDP-glucose 4,6-dehydratase [Lacrimispora defluvii]|uniref:CDP-glucose 4,6-dehydratase n=1 Tax=Lacrimispora defluvii TaxID=2719233 RepID=A0ABX1VYF6_9FIRM|nr:CDP-glucose 4,6-dehydratase [Lacrimispora defluvii]NNJ32824.1 CDP-glucose 4,6-dehydratase [Lacrimispora defluvii]
MSNLAEFYKGKKVLITGHTGFKGAWICKMLTKFGSQVIGYALEPPTNPNIFDISGLSGHIDSIIGDIQNYDELFKVFQNFKPEIVIHMAAQPIVRESYKNPLYTYSVNVMGTANILECIRNTDSVKSFVNVTTDKVYLNREWDWGYRENEELNGYDPYSNSKSCSELVTSSYLKSFFQDEEAPAVSTCRAGNVIGGGDFAADRIIPDCIRAVKRGTHIIVRNPYSTRPYQHVLEPVVAYLLLAMKQYQDKTYAGNYNIGPSEEDCWTTGDIVTLFCNKWNAATDKVKAKWVDEYDGGPHEANFLKLDCSKIKTKLKWEPVWNVETAIEKIIDWSIAYLYGDNCNIIMEQQIDEYLKGLLKI